jgi:L-amino acid N-acyltransferase YncA
MKKRGAPTKARLSNALNRWNRWQTVVIVTLGFVVPANAFLFFFSYLPNRTTAAVSSEDTAPKTILESIGSTTAIPRLPPGYSLGQVAAPSDMVLHRSGEWSIIALSRSDGTVVARFSRFAAPEEIRRAAEEDLRQAVPQASHLIENKESIRNMSIVWITLSLVGLSLVASVATLLIALRALEKGNRSERAGDKQLVILPWGGGRAVDLLLEELERRRSESEDGLKETSDASGNGSPAIIRLATEGDAQQIAAIYAPIVTDTIISFELEPPTAEEMRRRIEVTLQRYPWLVCERHHDGRLLGYAYAGAHHSKEAYQWSVDVSVYVHEEARRKGVGRALYTSLFAALALQGFYNAYAGATLPNPASVGLHESMGFRQVGVYRGVGYKLGAWHDVMWWHLPIRERVADPDPPADLPSRLGSEEWDAAMTNGLPLLRSSP